LAHPLKANINQVFWDMAKGQISVYGQGATVKGGTLRGNQVAHERDMGKGQQALKVRSEKQQRAA